MNTDKLVWNCFIFMGLDIIVEFIIYAFWFWWILLGSFCERTLKYVIVYLCLRSTLKKVAFNIRVCGSKV